MSDSFLKLPEKTELVLILIQTELKSRKLFHVLQQIGLEDCYLQPNLDSLIMQCLDMDDETDEAFLRYDGIMERGSGRIAGDGDVGKGKEAEKVLRELVRARDGMLYKDN